MGKHDVFIIAFWHSLYTSEGELQALNITWCAILRIATGFFFAVFLLQFHPIRILHFE